MVIDLQYLYQVNLQTNQRTRKRADFNEVIYHAQRLLDFEIEQEGLKEIETDQKQHYPAIDTNENLGLLFFISIKKDSLPAVELLSTQNMMIIES